MTQTGFPNRLNSQINCFWALTFFFFFLGIGAHFPKGAKAAQKVRGGIKNFWVFFGFKKGKAQKI